VETSAFDYELPPELIAQHPIEQRDAARLLVDRGPVELPDHRGVRDLPDLLAPGDLLVVNDTRVLPARLHLRKETGGAVEVLLLERLSADPTDGWEALVRPSRKVPPGSVLSSARPEVAGGVGVEVLDDLGEGRRRVRLIVVDPAAPAAESGSATALVSSGELDAITAMGEMPLPPYITAPLEAQERYQTVYASRPASAAAPTAGLHFTPELLDRVEQRGVDIANVELVVGLDTFRPILVADIADHRMHSEAYRVPAETWTAVERTKARGGNVIAVGTTAVRALESAAARNVLEGRTDLFIHGDHRFAIVDRLLTNFHLPKSSLLVLIDAFVGPHWRELYDEAVAERYRFLSFGDAMLLTRRDLIDPRRAGRTA
jgi:S-adenosylmethionine:tRNA ribosyltransferase-isomerase